MSGAAIYCHHQFPSSLTFHDFSRNNRKSVLISARLEGLKKWDLPIFAFSSSSSSSFSSQKPGSRPGFLVRASSVSSIPPFNGSAADYPEQPFGAMPKQIDRDEIEDPKLLADSDSCFCDFNGVLLHHKLCEAELPASDHSEESSNKPINGANFPVVLLHGFGSSTFSWNRIMKQLARITRSKVIAFDRPAFGLTSRVNVAKQPSHVKADDTSLNPYSMMFSVLATLFFMDFLDAEKVILVGHSAGSLVAVDTYFEAPERVAALILVAPAIFAPFRKQKIRNVDQLGNDNQISQDAISQNSMNLFSQLCRILLKFIKFIAHAFVRTIQAVGDILQSLYRKALSAFLRSTFGLTAVRMIFNKFGIPAIRAAWCDSNQVSDHILEGYTKPLKVKGWDKALVEYTVAILTDSASKLKLPLTKRLKDISCPVLIITGDTDRLVPAWNSKRLSQAIPGSCLEIIKNCGHLPQEEKAEEFVSVIDKFLQRVFKSAEEQCLQAMSP